MSSIFVPDFSHDDFANDPEIKKSRAKREAYNQMIGECLSILQSELQVESASHKNLHSFLMYKDLVRPTLVKSFRSNSPSMDLHVSIVQYYSSTRTARTTSSGLDDYVFGVLTLSKQFPHTMIIRETIREKIADIFTKVEIDFPTAKKFSRRFYVVSEDREKLYQLIVAKSLSELTIFPNMELEFKDQLCLFRLSRKSISVAETEKFVVLAKKLNEVFNGPLLPVL